MNFSPASALSRFCFLGWILTTGILLSTAVRATPPDWIENLSFHASFDHSENADWARGDARLFSIVGEGPSVTAEAQAGLRTNGATRLTSSGGRFGGALVFSEKDAPRVFFSGAGNLPEAVPGWEGTVSFWLRLDPDQDLEPGFSDPIQITSRSWNDAAFFVDFDRDTNPRDFRLGAFPDLAVWNPENRTVKDIPNAERPLHTVSEPPFDRENWTHVAFTWSGFNQEGKNGRATLYLNGRKSGTITGWHQQFTWEEMDDVRILLGLNYIGAFDELSVFDRALTEIEVKELFDRTDPLPLPIEAKKDELDWTVWQVGLGRRQITPFEPVRMDGYSGRVEASKGIAGDLHVKAMAIEDAAGTAAIAVTIDLAGIWSFLTDPVYEAVKEETGLSRDRFLFNCSHTHAGPDTGLDKVAEGTWTEENAAATIRYTRFLITQMIGAVRDAWRNRVPAKLSWDQGFAPFVMNRREFTDSGVRLGHQFSGPADRSVPVLKVSAPDGGIRAVMFGAACHNTTLTSKNHLIAGDFAGFAQQYLEQEFPGVQAMFVTGCGGDSNPYPRRGGDGWDHVHGHGHVLGKEVSRLLAEPLQPIRGPLRVQMSSAALPFAAELSRAELEAVAAGPMSSPAYIANSLIAKLDSGEPLPPTEEFPLSVWQFGDDLTWVALSGEVVVDYVYLLQNALGPLRLWISAYSHDLIGYVTSARVQQEGGYEAKGMHGKGIFALHTQDVYVEAVRKLAATAGRELP